MFSFSTVVRSCVIGCALLAAAGSPLIAQGRGGGGGRGGSVTLREDTPRQSPMVRIREELKETDELAFLDKRSKQLALDKEQKEKLKSLNKEQDESEKPILKDIESAFKELEKMGIAGGGGRGGPGGRGGMPEGIRESMTKLTSIQGSFGERAREILKPEQKAQADSLRPMYVNDLREQAQKKASRSGTADGRIPFVVGGGRSG